MRCTVNMIRTIYSPANATINQCLTITFSSRHSQFVHRFLRSLPHIRFDICHSFTETAASRNINLECEIYAFVCVSYYILLLSPCLWCRVWFCFISNSRKMLKLSGFRFRYAIRHDSSVFILKVVAVQNILEKPVVNSLNKIPVNTRGASDFIHKSRLMHGIICTLSPFLAKILKGFMTF